jgi:hypothetical protein
MFGRAPVVRRAAAQREHLRALGLSADDERALSAVPLEVWSAALVGARGGAEGEGEARGKEGEA